MYVIGFDGREHKLKLRRGKRKSCSSYHKVARDLIKSLFPYDYFYEEVCLIGSNTNKNNSLYADFFCPKLKLIFEIHGEQHYSFNSHFHKSKIDFIRSKNKDQTKIEWAELNGIRLIELPYSEEKQWKETIQKLLINL